MRFSLLLLLPTLLIFFTDAESQSPFQAHWVKDFDNLFSEQEEKVLDSVIAAYEEETTVEIVIVTIDTTMTTEANLEKYVTDLHNRWGIGKEESNNGVVIGIMAGHREMRISNGYGIEKLLSDDETQTIIDSSFVPLYREGQYFKGTLTGLQKIMAVMRARLLPHSTAKLLYLKPHFGYVQPPYKNSQQSQQFPSA